MPVSIVYYFSLDFLQRGIDNWFNVSVEETLEGALELSRASLEDKMREQLKTTEKISSDIAGASAGQLPIVLDDMRRANSFKELTLLSPGGHIVASSSDTPTDIIPKMPQEDVLLQVRQGNNYAGIEPFPGEGLHIRVLVNVTRPEALAEAQILQSLMPVTEKINTLAERVQQGYEQYRELGFMREPLKFSFVLTLSLVLLISVFAAVWAAFYSARRLVAPIRVLAIGTRLVSSGEYGKKLPMTSNDEFGVLVQSFNDMTKKIAQSRDEVEQSQQRAERQKAYLEAVLGRLSSGVLVMDKRHIIRTANKAASQIFGFELSQGVGRSIHEVSRDNHLFSHFAETIMPHLQDEAHEWREEVTFFGVTGRQVLMCRGASLLGEEDLAGYVIVFDDITALIQVQHDAAWGEVARRLAHEIKNPLTPIQLSAERLRHKYLAAMEDKDAQVLDRATNTIVQQVETMKEMVKAFSDYARSPKLKLQAMDINGLIEEVLDLYRDENGRITFSLQLHPGSPLINADMGRMRQLLNNLIKNAIEAIPTGEEGEVSIKTKCLKDAHETEFLELTVSDSGIGFPAELVGKIFDPYVTSKPKGSGLGLAIVKKIVEEHSGVISAENGEQGGALIVIRLPVVHQADSK